MSSYSDFDRDDLPEIDAKRAIIKIIAVAVAVIVGLGVLIGGCSGLKRTGPGEVAVIMNGGPLDSKDQRTTLSASQGYSFQGLFSSQRNYIAADQQRYYAISPDGGDSATTSITVPTKDGVQVSIEGRVNFHTNFNGDGATDEECETAGYESGCGDPILRDFDTTYGNRTFGEESKKIYEDGGWEEFLNAMVRPVIQSTFREEIGALECEDLVSSCALIEQGAAASKGSSLAKVGPTDQNNAEAFQKVADSVQTKLATRLDAALGGTYFGDYQVIIEGVVLPNEIQDKINTAQAAFAGIAESRANAESARYEALKNKRLSKSYDKAPVLGLIEAAKATAGGGGTVILDGSGGLGLNVGK